MRNYPGTRINASWRRLKDYQVDWMLKFILQMTNTVTSFNNCTAPWFLYYARWRLLYVDFEYLLFFRKHNLPYQICNDKKSSRNASVEFHTRRYEPYPECENPCEKMIITTLFNSKSPGKQELQIRFARQIQITEENLKVTPLEALANIGGYLGMILGNNYYCYLISWMIIR